jgi:hypothetical protein
LSTHATLSPSNHSDIKRERKRENKEREKEGGR